MSKYDAIASWLRQVEEAQVELSLEEVERTTGLRLPASAAKHPAFWAHEMIVRPLRTVGWKVQPLLREGRIRFTRGASRPPAEHPPSPSGPTPAPGGQPPDLVLVGCVKTKLSGRHPAKALFSSSLFKGRRARAEATGAPWYILSAKYGLVHPDTPVEDYDVYLPETPTHYRREWARRVLADLDSVVGDVRGKVVEIHAGEEYRSGIVGELRRRGAVVHVPLQGLRRGEQLAWYASGGEQTGRVTPAAVPGPAAAPQLNSRPRVTGQTVISEGLVRDLTRDFLGNRFDLTGRPGAPAASGWDEMPEALVARAMKGGGATDVQVRIFMTLVCAMDRARDAMRLWANALGLFKARPEFFDPVTVLSMVPAELRDGLATAGVSQRHSIDSAAWRRISEALIAEQSPAVVKRAVFNGDGDAGELLEAVQARDGAGQPWFPLLAGPKVSAMWARMLVAPGAAHLANLNRVPVAVDVQVRKVTEYLGVTDTGGADLEGVRREIQAAWASRASEVQGPPGLAGTTAFLDPILWFFGKWGCTHCESVGARRPISTACAVCRFPDRGGASAKPSPPADPTPLGADGSEVRAAFMNLAFIGIGAMGRHMARNLARAGFGVAVYDARAEAAAQLRGEPGVRIAAGLDDTVSGVEAVCLSLPGPAEVEAVVAELRPLLARGTLVIDFSTNSPSLVRRLAASLAEEGIGLLDAPVSGGDDGAAAATLAVMVGGPAAQFERSRPVFEAIGKNVYHCGEVGAGSVTKLCNNLAGAVNGLAAAEVLTLGVKAGVELGTLAEVIGASTGASWKMSNRFPLRLFKGQFEPGFSVRLSAKDTALALELADELGVPIEAGRLAQAALAEALERGWAGLDVDAVARLQEERAGVQLRLPEGQ